MKKLLLLFMLLLISCSDMNIESNTEQSLKVINNYLKHPIVVAGAKHYLFDNTIDYTLIDSSGYVYQTGRTYLVLPDTIK